MTAFADTSALYALMDEGDDGHGDGVATPVAVKITDMLGEEVLVLLDRGPWPG